MKRLLMAAALSTSCFLLSSCGKKRVVESIPIPAERMDCVKTAKRPALPPEYAIDWRVVGAAPNVGAAVKVAQGEVAKLISSVRTREGKVAGYVIKIEGELFACSNDATWLREWQAATNR